jgi:hypothetical protein
MKRMLMVVLLAMSFALLFTQVALADSHVITHDDMLNGADVTIKKGDSVTFEFFWYAGTPGLVREFIRCSAVTLQINQDGNTKFFAGPPKTKGYWGPIERATPDFIADMFTWANSHAKTPVSLAYWRMALPTETLEEGNYNLSWALGWDHPTVDLGDWDGDGRIDHYPPDTIDDGIVLHIIP